MQEMRSFRDKLIWDRRSIDLGWREDRFDFFRPMTPTERKRDEEAVQRLVVRVVVQREEVSPSAG